MNLRMARLAIVLLLILAMPLTACSMIEIDTDKDNAEIVAQVGDEVLTKGEFAEQLSAQINMLESYYGTLPAEYIPQLGTEVFNQALELLVLKAKVKQVGLDKLTEEEEAKIKTDGQSSYDSTLEYYKSALVEQGFTDAEALEKAKELMTQEGLTLESYEGQQRDQILQKKAEEYATKDVTVEPAEVQAEYDRLVAQDTTEFAQDIANLDYKVSSGSTIYAYPEGMRAVKHILLKYPEEYDTKIKELASSIQSLESQIQDSITAEQPDETPTPESTPVPQATADPAMIDQLNELNAQLEAQMHAGAQAIQAKIDEVQGKINAGEPFDALMATYGEDPGMQKEPAMTEGYFVAAGLTAYHAQFTNAAMALAQAGDVSEPVLSQSGVHFIRYDHDITPGGVPLDKVSETITASLTTTKKSEAFTAAKAAWVEELKPTTFPEKVGITQ